MRLSSVTSKPSWRLTWKGCRVRRVCRAWSERSGGAAGVTQARVNYATGRAEVVVDSAQVDVALLQAAVERAGYGLAEIDDEPGREARAKGRT